MNTDKELKNENKNEGDGPNVPETPPKVISSEPEGVPASKEEIVLPEGVPASKEEIVLPEGEAELSNAAPEDELKKLGQQMIDWSNSVNRVLNKIAKQVKENKKRFGASSNPPLSKK